MSSQFVLVDTRIWVLQNMPKAFREKSYKIFAQSPRIETKNWFFRTQSPMVFFWTRRLPSSTLPEIIQPNWKKGKVQNYVFFRTFPSTPRKQVWQLYLVFFCSESNNGENLKTVSFSLVFPQNVPLELMNANLTNLPTSFSIEKKLHIMCGNHEKTLILPKTFNFPTLFHWTRKGSLTILPNVFWPNSETSSFCKSFQKFIFFRKFLWTSKSHFWQACRNHFCQKLY